MIFDSSRMFYTVYFAVSAFLFLTALQYWTWAETLEPGQQYPNPVPPCAVAAFVVTPVIMLILRGITLIVQWWDQKTAVRAAHRTPPDPPPCTQVRLDSRRPVRVIWDPPDGLVWHEDAVHAARLAFENDAELVVVKAGPAGEHAARILINAAWPGITAGHANPPPCPRVAMLAQGGMITSPNINVIIGEQPLDPDLVRTKVRGAP